MFRLAPAYPLIPVPAHFFSYPCFPLSPPRIFPLHLPLSIFFLSAPLLIHILSPCFPASSLFPSFPLSPTRTLSASFLHSPASFFPSSTHSPPSRAPAFSRFSTPAHSPYFFSAPSAIRSLALSPLPLQSLVLFCFVPPHLFSFFPPRIPRPSHAPSLPSPRSFPALSGRLPPSDFILYYNFFLSFRSLLACSFLVVFIRNFYKIAQQRTLGCSKSQKTGTEKNRKQSTGRQHSLPGRRKQAQKNKQRERKKDKNGKTKTKEEKSGKNTPEYRSQSKPTPLSPYKKRTARRSDGNSRIHRIRTAKTESGQNQKRNVPKSKAQKTSGLRNAIARKIFCREGGAGIRAIKTMRAAQTYGPYKPRGPHGPRNPHMPHRIHNPNRPPRPPGLSPTLRASRKDSGSFLPRRRNISLTNEKKCCIIDATEQKSRGFRKQSGSHG